MILFLLYAKNIEKNKSLKKKVIFVVCTNYKSTILIGKDVVGNFLQNIVILLLMKIFYFYLKKNHLIHIIS